MSETLRAVACALLSAWGLARLQSAEDILLRRGSGGRVGHYNYYEATA